MQLAASIYILQVYYWKDERLHQRGIMYKKLAEISALVIDITTLSLNTYIYFLLK